MDYYRRVRSLLGDEEDEDYKADMDFQRQLRKDDRKSLRDARLEQDLGKMVDWTMRATTPVHGKQLPPMPDMMEGHIRDLKESSADRQDLRNQELERAKLLDSLDAQKSAIESERQHKRDVLNLKKGEMQSKQQAASKLAEKKHINDFLKSEGYKNAQKGIQSAAAVDAQLKIGSDHLAAGNTQKAVNHMKSILKMINQMLVNSPDAVSEGEIKLLAPELEIASFQKLLASGEGERIIGPDPAAFIKKLKLMSNASARRHHQNQLDAYTTHMQGFNPKSAEESLSKRTKEYGDLMTTGSEKKEDQPVKGDRDNIGPTEYIYNGDKWVPVK